MANKKLQTLEFATLTDTYTIPQPGTTTPSMDGTAAAGSSNTYARADHVHPKDTSKQDALTFDATPTANSTNPVTSGGVKAALEEVDEAIEDVRSDINATLIANTASGSIAAFSDGADVIPVKSLSVNINSVQSGSGDPSPDNVRPITGWTGAQVLRTRKNLADYNTAQSPLQPTTTISILRNQDGFRIYSSVSGTYRSARIDVPLKAGVRYTLSADAEVTDGLAYIAFRRISDHRLMNYSTKITEAGHLSLSYTPTDDNILYLCFFGTDNNAGTCDVTYKNIQLEIGGSETSYEPYQGDTYSIDWTSEAGTVYGGTLDVTSGALTVDRKSILLDGTQGTWSTTASLYGNAFYKSLASVGMSDMQAENSSASRSSLCICDHFSPLTTSWANGFKTNNTVAFAASADNYFALNLGYAVTSDEANAWLAENNVRLVYPLETPITYQLTPTEITTLLGENRIWADTGDVDVTYRADTKLYIDKKIAAVIAALS